MAKNNEYPKVLSVAGPLPYAPQYTIILDADRRLQFEDGRVDVANAEEEAAVRKALNHDGIAVHENDSDIPLRIPGLAWVTFSSTAREELMAKLPPIVR